MSLSQQQEEALKAVGHWYKNLSAVQPYFYLGGFAGTGKALDLEAELQSPHGPIKMKNIKVGDKIFGKNGKPTTVTGVFPQGVRPSYKVTFRDGMSVICDEDHLWTVATQKDKQKDKWRTITTKQIIEDGVIRPSGSMRYCIPLCKPVEYEEKQYPIDPYDFGLGVASGEKHIPNDYKFGSVQQRISLLRGLMDSDGCVRGNRVYFSTTSPKLRDDVVHLVQSLGGTAIINKEDERSDSSVCYSINIKMFQNPFSKKHNANDWRYSEKNPPSRYIMKIEKVEDREMQCISVDAEDKLYLTDHFIVTHNTTLAKHFAQYVDDGVAYCAFTGKASMVLSKKGCTGASTIHSLIYKPLVNEKTGEVKYVLNNKSPVIKVGLIIADECSMINDKMGLDLLSFGIPILVLGDPAQLPPVGGAGYFTSGTPHFMLTEIHRQALDNPIIYLATKVRNLETLQAGNFGDSKVTKKFIKDEIMNADTMLVGTNKLRQRMNQIFRQDRGFSGAVPNVGETLICLKNNKDLNIFNGELFTVNDVKDYGRYHRFGVESQDVYGKNVGVKVLKYMFEPELHAKPTDFRILYGYDEMDFGYTLTVHKSQGSQWDNVYLADESSIFREDWAKWLYTGITRAAERITVNID